MLKKILIVVGLLVVGSWVWAKTDLGSYIKTGWNELWTASKKQVPVGFEIKRAEQMLASLEKVDDRLITTIASEMVTVKRMEREVDELTAGVERLRTEVQARNEDLKSREFVNTSGGEKVAAQLAKDLERSFKHLKHQEAALKAKQELLVEHKQRLESAKEQREGLKAEKSQLQARIEKLKTDVELLKAAETRSKCGLDDSQVGELNKLKELVDGLEQRIETQTIELQIREESRPSPAVKPIVGGAGLSKEIDEYLAGRK